MWVQNRIKEYPIPMTNFSTCWNDGLAFCALIHVFYPEAFDWSALKPENRRHNFTLAFQKAEELADIYPLLEVEDMVRFKKPDWKCVFTYVQSFYRRFRDGRSPPKTGPIIPSQTQATLSAVAIAVAENQQAEERGKQIVEQIKRQNSVSTPTKTKEPDESKSEDKEAEGRIPAIKQESITVKSQVSQESLAKTENHSTLVKQTSAPVGDRTDISTQKSNNTRSKSLAIDKDNEQNLTADIKLPNNENLHDKIPSEKAGLSMVPAQLNGQKK